ncbi:sugar isomerase (sis) [Lucifera butyrica]|uniref:N-acetylmuramic acid 6-phosphate etherase n=1 Tax=Lucifera butyrica TaxID=1351585 RepID=A0A498R532_9FIRM|nr:N-acetylmuramic acid 6-phosphate etherase [Lucifera butyrica]VBB05372.1 sugar isomerase (sis) [Lucifera butyrica]
MKQVNPDTFHIDEVSSLEMVRMFNNEDKKVAFAVEKQLTAIAAAVDIISRAIKENGRVIYIGSGTGGKLAVADATECPPTFGVSDDTIAGIISGGSEALCGWREETEDDENLARQDLSIRKFSSRDILVGISASGNTPYVLAGIRYAKETGAQTIGICCSPEGRLNTLADLCITVDAGPEVIMGSTRLKAGTAQKMILNMLSSCAMIKLGKTYHNLMVDVRPINAKLKRRVIDIIKISTERPENEILAALDAAAGNTKEAILMLTLNIDVSQARRLLAKHEGYLKKAIKGDHNESDL